VTLAREENVMDLIFNRARVSPAAPGSTSAASRPPSSSRPKSGKADCCVAALQRADDQQSRDRQVRMPFWSVVTLSVLAFLDGVQGLIFILSNAFGSGS
jgi:hypothetical protein